MTNNSTNIDYSDSDFQVPKQARKKDLVESQNVEVRSIECISNPNAL